MIKYFCYFLIINFDLLIFQCPKNQQKLIIFILNVLLQYALLRFLFAVAMAAHVTVSVQGMGFWIVLNIAYWHNFSYHFFIIWFTPIKHISVVKICNKPEEQLVNVSKYFAGNLTWQSFN